MDDRKKPLVSVIVPVYNAESYIDRCLESICSQSFSDIEILLMLSICTDRSLNHCAEWQKRDKRIIIVSRKDNSLGDARNFAFQIARGKYIVYVDADDYIEQDYILGLAGPLEDNEDVTISCCGFDISGMGERNNEWIPSKSGVESSSFDFFLENIPHVMVWLKMYRKDWLLEHNIHMFDGCHEDDAWHLCLAATVKNIYFVPYALYHYNAENENSLIHGIGHRREYISALRYAFAYLKDQDLYTKNKNKIQEFTIYSTMAFLKNAHYEKELFDEILEFWEEFFPEAALGLKLYGESEKKIEQNVVIFGAGADCERMLRKSDADGIAYIVDNDEKKAGRKIEGIPIVPFRRLMEESKPTLVLIASSRYFFEMIRQLRENGIKNYMDFAEYQGYKKSENKKKEN